MAATKLSEQEALKELAQINEGLTTKQHWQINSGKLVKQFVFKDFIQEFSWMTQVALIAEKLNNHPEWSNVWNKVDVALVTHDVDGISDLDMQMIKHIENLNCG